MKFFSKNRCGKSTSANKAAFLVADTGGELKKEEDLRVSGGQSRGVVGAEEEGSSMNMNMESWVKVDVEDKQRNVHDHDMEEELEEEEEEEKEEELQRQHKEKRYEEEKKGDKKKKKKDKNKKNKTKREGGGGRRGSNSSGGGTAMTLVPLDGVKGGGYEVRESDICPIVCCSNGSEEEEEEEVRSLSSEEGIRKSRDIGEKGVGASVVPKGGIDGTERESSAEIRGERCVHGEAEAGMSSTEQQRGEVAHKRVTCIGDSVVLVDESKCRSNNNNSNTVTTDTCSSPTTGNTNRRNAHKAKGMYCTCHLIHTNDPKSNRTSGKNGAQQHHTAPSPSSSPSSGPLCSYCRWQQRTESNKVYVDMATKGSGDGRKIKASGVQVEEDAAKQQEMEILSEQYDTVPELPSSNAPAQMVTIDEISLRQSLSCIFGMAMKAASAGQVPSMTDPNADSNPLPDHNKDIPAEETSSSTTKRKPSTVEEEDSVAHIAAAVSLATTGCAPEGSPTPASTNSISVQMLPSGTTFIDTATPSSAASLSKTNSYEFLNTSQTVSLLSAELNNAANNNTCGEEAQFLQAWDWARSSAYYQHISKPPSKKSNSEASSTTGSVCGSTTSSVHSTKHLHRGYHLRSLQAVRGRLGRMNGASSKNKSRNSKKDAPIAYMVPTVVMSHLLNLAVGYNVK
eukprot:Nk52_evm13s503 gene=Nk52_evmTU13s503